MTRVLGVDLGARRIGLAVSDPSGTLASPLQVLERGIDHAHDHRAIVQVARDHGVERLVVGWPRSLSGDEGPAALAVRDEVVELEAAAGLALPVVLHDERFSTVTATRRLREGRLRQGRSRGRTRGSRGARRAGARAPVDAAAAAVFLQSYLDATAASREAP